MSEDLSRKNELELVSIKGELKLLSQKLDVLKTNDIYHLQKSLDTMSRRLWAIGFLILGQIVVALRLTVWG
jgi:hypothetical protein|tara:strand:- start:433 stop:645 length:213 start_codon:yes stop_codon:yes gene_type:complete